MQPDPAYAVRLAIATGTGTLAAGGMTAIFFDFEANLTPVVGPTRVIQMLVRAPPTQDAAPPPLGGFFWDYALYDNNAPLGYGPALAPFTKWRDSINTTNLANPPPEADEVNRVDLIFGELGPMGGGLVFNRGMRIAVAQRPVGVPPNLFEVYVRYVYL